MGRYSHIWGNRVPDLLLPGVAAEHGDDMTGENFESQKHVTCGLCGEDISPVYRRLTSTYEDKDGRQVTYHNAYEHAPEDIRRWQKGQVKHVCLYTHYEAADRYLRRARDGYSRPIANNTRLIRLSDDRIAIRLHATDVITLYADGATEFRTGGWHTVTTRQRLGRNSNYRFWSERIPNPNPRFDPDSEWVVSFGTWSSDGAYPAYIFEEGITFDANGNCLTDAKLASEEIARRKAERAEGVARNRKVRGGITRFTNATMKALANGGLPIDGPNPLDTEELRALVVRAEPSASLVMRVVAKSLPGDAREWLDLTERDGEVIARTAPVIEPIVRRKLRETLTAQLVS